MLPQFRPDYTYYAVLLCLVPWCSAVDDSNHDCELVTSNDCTVLKSECSQGKPPSGGPVLVYQVRQLTQSDGYFGSRSESPQLLRLPGSLRQPALQRGSDH